MLGVAVENAQGGGVAATPASGGAQRQCALHCGPNLKLSQHRVSYKYHKQPVAAWLVTCMCMDMLHSCRLLTVASLTLSAVAAASGC
jgi:hypothetical protein